MIRIYSISISVLIAFVGLFLIKQDEKAVHTFTKIELSEEFYGEGTAIGDINNDGNQDVVCGPFWYEGPDFTNRKTFYKPVKFTGVGDSNSLVVADVNGDGWNDILKVGRRGQDASWFENPQEKELESETGYSEWNKHLIHPNVDNESAGFYDVNSDGMPDLVFHTEGYLGYATMVSNAPMAPWIFHRISEQHDWGRFQHGVGVGDITGNGYMDFMMNEGWWEHPGAGWDRQSLWQFHPVDFSPVLNLQPGQTRVYAGQGGAQMYTTDVDGDGLNDVITSLESHGWGLAWFRQIRNKGVVDFEMNLIMGEFPSDNPYGVRFSQLHALELSDIDGDGLQDIVTGKRFRASGSGRNIDHQSPAVLYWFKPHRMKDGSVNFIPYLVDNDSGVGNQFSTGDLTGNGYPDIVTCNKQGGFVFLNQPESVTLKEWEEAQPELLSNDAIKETNKDIDIHIGRGTFTFDHYLPLREKPLRVWYYNPGDNNVNIPVMILMHGNGRGAEGYRDAMSAYAERYNFLLIVPEFSHEYFPSSRDYHQGGVLTEDGKPVDEENWAFSLIEPLFDYVKEDTGNQNDKYILYGFSAGSQFVHRFMMHKPGNRAGSVISASAGTYSMPDFDIPYPYGIGGTVVQKNMLEEFYKRDVTIMVGAADTVLAREDLTKTPSANRQGRDRVERGIEYFIQSKKTADSLGFLFNWNLVLTPGIGHHQDEIAGPVARRLFEN